MSFGKLYGFKVFHSLLDAHYFLERVFFETDYVTLQENARSTVLLAVAKANNLDIEVVETRIPIQDIEYFKLNPLGRVPTFVGPNGYLLTETMAIAVYCTSNLSFVRLHAVSKMSHIINTVIPV